MSETENDNLAAKYDEFYAADETDNEAKLIQVLARWPKNRNEAMVYLARPGGRLLEIGSGVPDLLWPRFARAI